MAKKVGVERTDAHRRTSPSSDARRRVLGSEEGSVIPIFLAAVLVLFMAMAALFYVGKASNIRTHTQAAADAAALAAVSEIRDRAVAQLSAGILPYAIGYDPQSTPARARDYAQRNGATVTSIKSAGVLRRSVVVKVRSKRAVGFHLFGERIGPKRATAKAIATVDFPVCYITYTHKKSERHGALYCNGTYKRAVDPGAFLDLSFLSPLYETRLVAKPPPDLSILGYAGPAPGNVSSPANRRLGQKMAAQVGWTGAEWQCLDWVYQHESGWNQYADNPTSPAYGIPQALPGSKMSTAGADWRTNPRTQINWGLDYIRRRYGTPCSAKSFWIAHNWY